MRILITTGIYPPQIGGPAQYAKNLEEALKKKGLKTKIATFRFEHYLPSGIRHVFFFFKILPSLLKSDFCIALDTFSVGLPSVLAGKILKKKVIVRTGGDFLWEQYVERTGKKVLLKNFYKTEIGNFSFREKIIFKLTKWTLRSCSALVFSTDWQRQIWRRPYKLDLQKNFISDVEREKWESHAFTFPSRGANIVPRSKAPRDYIIENYYGPKEASSAPDKKIFIGSTRNLKWKNSDVLRSAFDQAKEINSELILDLENLPYEKFLEKLKNCYAVILVSLGDISPNLILDAIRFGKPFILTKESGICERVRDIGIFVDPMNYNEIAEKILFLADSKNYDEQRKKIDNFSFIHSWEEISNEFLDILEELRANS